MAGANRLQTTQALWARREEGKPPPQHWLYSPMRGTTRMNFLQFSSVIKLLRWSMNPLVSGTKKTGLISSSICLI